MQKFNQILFFYGIQTSLNFELLPRDGHLEKLDPGQGDVRGRLDEVLVVLPHGEDLVLRRGVDAGVGDVGALAGHGEVAAVKALLDVEVLALSTVQLPVTNTITLAHWHLGRMVE